MSRPKAWLPEAPVRAIGPVVLLTLLALYLRLFRIEQIPPGLQGDELFNAIDSLQIGPGFWPVFFEGNNGREALYFYFMAASLRLFGESIWAIRLPSVLLGTAITPLTYAIGHRAFNRRLALVSAGLVTVSLWPLMHSRWGLRAVSLTFFSGLTVCLYQRAFAARGRAWLSWSAAGLSLGLSIYTYIPARALPLVILGWLAWRSAGRRAWWGRHWTQVGLSLLVALAVFAPLGRYMIRYPEKVNRRIGTLTTSLDRAARGEPEAILETLAAVPDMFFISGDAAARYFVVGRPVFDPLVGALFLLGLVVALILAFKRRAPADRRGAYGLVLLWLAAMLAPNAFVGLDSATLRAAGAIIPAYLLTGLGLDRLARWLAAWPAGLPGGTRRVRSYALWAGIAAGLALTLLGAWQAYSKTWANDNRVRVVYHSGLAQVGSYLDGRAAPDGVELFVAYDYVADATPRLFTYFSDADVAWFDHRNSLAWRPDGGQAWYFVPSERPLAPTLRARLAAKAEVQTVSYASGEAAFDLFRAPPAGLDWQPQIEASGQFANGQELVGLDLSETLTRGQNADLLLHWRIPEDLPGLPNRLTFATLRLVDGSGNVWGQAESLMGYPEAGWRAGDRYVLALTLEIPVGMPPGAAYLEPSLRDWGGATYDSIGGPLAPIGPIPIGSQTQEAIELASDAPVYDETLALQEHGFSTLVQPGQPVEIYLDWLALKTPEVNYQARLALSLPGAAEPYYIQTYDLWPDVYPPTMWKAGELVRTFHRLNIPLDLPAEADPLLTLDLLPPADGPALPVTQGSNVLAQLKLILRERLYERPTIEQPLTAEVNFGQGIRLLGFDLDTRQAFPGGEVGLTLYWQALGTPDTGYTVFNHLTDAGGQIRGQFDSPPVSDGWLTTTWLPGEFIVDERVIPIESDAPAGEYQIIVGLYTSADGLRAALTVDGQLVPDDRYHLATIEVRP